MIKSKSIKNNILFLLIIVIVIVLLIIAGFLYYLRTKEGTAINENNVVLYSNIENITLKSGLSSSDKFGKSFSKNTNSSFGYLDFEIVNVCDTAQNYQIFVKKNYIEQNEINSNYIKFYLTDQDDYPIGEFDSNIVPSFNKLKYIEDKPSSKLLYSGKLDSYQNKRMRLRVWIAENYVSTDDDKVFSFDIGVRAV